MFVSTFESLESRTLFAAAPPVATVVEAGGVVDVTGTKKADDIHVRLNADGVTLEVAHNGVLLNSFPASAVSLVRVDAGKGHDNVHVDANVLVNTQLSGGVGNDMLTGGGGNDLLIGGNGRDQLAGDAGNDNLDGGNGADVLNAGLGDDILLGGNGGDTMDGGDGNDNLTGGKGRDAITGGVGADVFANSDKVWELRDLDGVEDTYTININPIDIIDDFFGGLL
jgi:Ca2+-binding RTX toxin-like protein